VVNWLRFVFGLSLCFGEMAKVIGVTARYFASDACNSHTRHEANIDLCIASCIASQQTSQASFHHNLSAVVCLFTAALLALWWLALPLLYVTPDYKLCSLISLEGRSKVDNRFSDSPFTMAAAAPPTMRKRLASRTVRMWIAVLATLHLASVSTDAQSFPSIDFFSVRMPHALQGRSPNSERPRGPLTYRTFTTTNDVLRNVSVYIDPHFSKIAPVPAPSGQLCRFVNLSNRTMEFRKVNGAGQKATFLQEILPMQSTELIATAGAKYLIKNIYSGQTAADFTVTDDKYIYVYDSSHRQYHYWKDELRQTYLLWQDTLALSLQYTKWTGRRRLSHAHRGLPKHYIYPTDFVGQTYTVQNFHHYEFSPKHDYFNVTVLSCAPRILKITNFISEGEIQHLMWLTSLPNAEWEVDFHGNPKENKHTELVDKSHNMTRNPRQLWLAFERSIIVQNLYARAADVLHLEPLDFVKVTEPMHVFHYQTGAGYKPQYEYTSPPVELPEQPTRFATITMYLNDNFEGGETDFPRISKTIQPVTGTAILYYHVLPDGNMDELIQVQTLPVTKGEMVSEPHVMKQCVLRLVASV
jgi:prolyl 4-hydroxylase